MKSMSARGSKCFLGDAISLQFAVGNRRVNSREILVNDATGAEIKMTYLRIAHLSLRQTNVRAAGAQFAARIIAIKLVVEWSAREQRGVSVFFRFHFSAGIDSPAVTNDEHDRT